LLSAGRFRSIISSTTATMVITPAKTDIAMIGTNNGFDSMSINKRQVAEIMYRRSMQASKKFSANMNNSNIV